MKKAFALIMLIMLLSACGKKNIEKTSAPLETPMMTPQATSQSATLPSEGKKESEIKPSGKDLTALIEKLDKTTDEQERKKILAEIQVILESAEKQK